MNENDFVFSNDQKRFKKGKYLNAVEQFDQSNVNFIQKLSKKHSNSINVASSSSVIDKNLSGSESVSTSSENSDMSISFDLKTTCVSNKSLLQQNRVSLEELAMVCERYEVSDRAGAAVSSATLILIWNCYRKRTDVL